MYIYMKKNWGGEGGGFFFEKRRRRRVLQEDGPDQLLSCFERQYSEGIAVLVVWLRPRRTRRRRGEGCRSHHFD